MRDVPNDFFLDGVPYDLNSKKIGSHQNNFVIDYFSVSNLNALYLLLIADKR